MRDIFIKAFISLDFYIHSAAVLIIWGTNPLCQFSCGALWSRTRSSRVARCYRRGCAFISFPFRYGPKPICTLIEASGRPFLQLSPWTFPTSYLYGRRVSSTYCTVFCSSLCVAVCHRHLKPLSWCSEQPSRGRPHRHCPSSSTPMALLTTSFSWTTYAWDAIWIKSLTRSPSLWLVDLIKSLMEEETSRPAWWSRDLLV